MAKRLSSRELAVKAKKKAALAVAPKVSSRAVAKSPLVGAGPLMTGQTRQAPMAGPSLTGKVTPGYYDYSNNSVDIPGFNKANREAASKAQTKKDSLRGALTTGAEAQKNEASLLGYQASDKGAGSSLRGAALNVGKNILSHTPGASTLMSAWEAQRKNGGFDLTDSLGISDNFQTPSQEDMNSLFGIENANAQGLDIVDPTGGSDLEKILNTTPTQTMPNQTRPSNQPFAVKNEVAGSNTSPTDTPRKKDWVNPWGSVDVSGENSDQSGYDYSGGSNSGVMNPQAAKDEYSRQQNEDFGGGPQPDVVPPQVTRQVRGSGLFGTGKGVGNPAGGQDDPYIKELRKAYSSNGGEKWLRKQFEELISALDPTYAQLQTEGTNALNENLRNNSNQLASVMNAGNVGDSEQRTQQLAGLQQGNQTALGQLLAKLATAKAGDVSQYKSSMADKMGQLQERNQTNAQKLQEAIRNYQNDKYDQEYKNASLSQKGGQKDPKNMSLKAIGFDKFGTEVRWVDQSTGDIYEADDF